jgi:hypothetical protein
MMRSPRTEQVKLAVILLLLTSSIPTSFLSIPFGPFWGLDFQNLFAFHHCAARDNPYLSTGAACGDASARDMFYPPALYWAFAWVRLVPFQIGLVVWALVIGLGTLAAAIVWIPRERWRAPGCAPLGLFVGLMIAQYPVLFAIERGNNDVVVLLAWTLFLVLLQSGRPGKAGIVAGAAAAAKLYPLFACAVVALAFTARALRDAQARRECVALVGGMAMSGAVAVVAFCGQTRHYLADQLPRFTSFPRPPPLAFSHVLFSIVDGALLWIFKLTLFAAWAVGAARTVRRDLPLAAAGALAISTYFASVSYDYNLISTYPLLVLLFVRSTNGRANALAFGLLLTGLAAVIAGRYPFMNFRAAHVARVALGWGWLVATGLAAAKLSAEEDPTCAGAPAATALASR